MSPTTFIDRTFLRTKDGFYQEVFEHYIVYVQGADKKRLKDKSILGGLYREASVSDHSMEGEVNWTDNQGTSRRLIGVKYKK